MQVPYLRGDARKQQQGNRDASQPEGLQLGKLKQVTEAPSCWGTLGGAIAHLSSPSQRDKGAEVFVHPFLRVGVWELLLGRATSTLCVLPALCAAQNCILPWLLWKFILSPMYVCLYYFTSAVWNLIIRVLCCKKISGTSFLHSLLYYKDFFMLHV